jgi:hypothetical protein
MTPCSKMLLMCESCGRSLARHGTTRLHCANFDQQHQSCLTSASLSMLSAASSHTSRLKLRARTSICVLLVMPCWLAASTAAPAATNLHGRVPSRGWQEGRRGDKGSQHRHHNRVQGAGHALGQLACMFAVHDLLGRQDCLCNR